MQGVYVQTSMPLSEKSGKSMVVESSDVSNRAKPALISVSSTVGPALGSTVLWSEASPEACIAARNLKNSFFSASVTRSASSVSAAASCRIAGACCGGTLRSEKRRAKSSASRHISSVCVSFSLPSRTHSCSMTSLSATSKSSTSWFQSSFTSRVSRRSRMSFLRAWKFLSSSAGSVSVALMMSFTALSPLCDGDRWSSSWRLQRKMLKAASSRCQGSRQLRIK
mmetsp:Transcript_10311/g.22829  ORF Transcript_10311/g.22829 Transcript_10311/m.22829 type:complete len:224 (+) Transcript_10311:90-761(+)